MVPKTLTILLLLITNIQLFSQIFDISLNNKQPSNLFLSDVFSDNYTFNVENTSINLESQNNNIEFIDIKEFMYADTRRYTISGDLPMKNTNIKPLPATIFTASLAGIFILQHKMQMETIWKEHTDNFKIYDDGAQELWLDKVGHIYGSYTAAYFLREGLLVSGIGWNTANILAAGLGVAYSTYVEILDGYGEHWGFSTTDWVADIAGGLFFAAQNYFPPLQNISPKFMYIPSEWTGYKSRIPHDMFIDDYSSQFFFFSINIHNLLPEKWKKYYPTWLELSVGYTVRNILENIAPERQHLQPCSECISIIDGYWGSPRLVIALDYNLVKILPDGGIFWNWLKQSLNLLKLPSPALEIGKVTRFYLLFPFKIL